MLPPPNEPPIPGSYVWTCPGCPLRILLSLDVVERLRQDLLDNSAQDRELGGLLIGSLSTGTVEISEFIPLPARTDSGDPHFALESAFLDEVIARCPSGGKVVGYYRTDQEQLIRLRTDDLDLIHRRFRDPSSACLVIAPARGPGVRAGFFVWQGEQVPLNPNLTFPFSAGELASRGWPIQIRESWGDKANRVASQAPLSFLRGSEARVITKVAGLAAVMALLITAVASIWNASNLSPPRLGLNVHGDGTKFSVTWNRSSPQIANAKEASIAIWDSSRVAADGSTEPLVLPVTVARLRSGGMTYTSFAPTEKVQFRLEITTMSGETSSETVASISSVPTPPLEETDPPKRSRPAKVATAEARVEQSSRAKKTAVAGRVFALPKPAAASGVSPRMVILEPPQIVAGNQTRLLSGGLPDQLPAFAGTSIGSVNPPPRADPAPSSNLSGPGVVTITSEPSGADVQINSLRAGTTPLAIQISPVGLGFTVTVTKTGFMKWTIQTSATAQPYALHAQLREAPR